MRGGNARKVLVGSSFEGSCYLFVCADTGSSQVVKGCVAEVWNGFHDRRTLRCAFIVHCSCFHCLEWYWYCS